jgi:CHAD domain-containing protein
MKEILRRTLAVLRANEEGIKADWDVEFLHDYRTAVRRTRSALSQVPGVFAPEATERYKEAFAQLGERSNQLRDLDVYLLAEPRYRAMLPNAMRDHIAPLFDYLQSQRRQALREVVDYLDSAPYVVLMEAWQAFLHEPVSDVTAAPNAALPIDELARRRIARQYRRVIKDGNRILDSDEDELIHQLRIDCKKLRYLLEFFASLFAANEINRLIRQLRILQDELGMFNDLSVQQDYLLRVAEVFPADDAQGKMALVAIGFLVEKLAGEQQAMKPGLAQVFSEFAAAPNRALFRQLLGAKQKGSES